MKLRYLDDPQQQTCKICGKKDKFDFNLPGIIWEAVVPPIFQNSVVCLSCFDDLAAGKDINYADFLQTLYFAGEKISIIFFVRSTDKISPICSSSPSP